MKIDRNKFESSLSKKGFKKAKNKDHIYYFHEYNGKETGIKTKVSHSPKFRDISGDILTSIRKQLKLSNNMQVKKLADCPMSKNDYINYLFETEYLQA